MKLKLSLQILWKVALLLFDLLPPEEKEVFRQFKDIAERLKNETEK